MDSTESLLDDLYSRSSRLEKKNAFIVHLPLSELVSQSREVSNIKKENEDQIYEKGLLLLAEQDGGVLNTLEILNKIQFDKIKTKQNLSFSEKVENKYEELVFKTLISTQKDSNYIKDKFINNSSNLFWKSNSFSNHLSIGQRRSPTVSIYPENYFPSFSKLKNQIKTDLSKDSRHFGECLSVSKENFALEFSKSINLNENRDKISSDIFLLIHYLNF